MIDNIKINDIKRELIELNDLVSLFVIAAECMSYDAFDRTDQYKTIMLGMKELLTVVNDKLNALISQISQC